MHIEPMLNHVSASDVQPRLNLPATVWQAMLRGIRGQCPRCGGASLFRRFLKPAATCSACQQDWTPQQADDFPAYVSIIVTGHLLAPVMIALVRDTELSTAALMAIILPLTCVMMIGLLQPAKGATIAVQWWYGMHGFRPDRLQPTKGTEGPL